MSAVAATARIVGPNDQRQISARKSGTNGRAPSTWRQPNGRKWLAQKLVEAFSWGRAFPRCRLPVVLARLQRHPRRKLHQQLVGQGRRIRLVTLPQLLEPVAKCDRIDRDAGLQKDLDRSGELLPPQAISQV